MGFLEVIDERVPEPIRLRVRQLREEVDAINDAAMANFVTEIPRRISFRVSGNSSVSWDGDLMPPEERAQAVSFVVRYQHLRDDLKVHIGPDAGGDWHIMNLWELRHMLNDVRPIIQNQKDSTFYTHVNATIQKRLRRTDTTQDPDEEGIRSGHPRPACFVVARRTARTVFWQALGTAFFVRHFRKLVEEGHVHVTACDRRRGSSRGACRSWPRRARRRRA